LQGGGQEFESPRLHHLRPPPARKSKRPGTTPGARNGTRTRMPSQDPVDTLTGPLIRVLHRAWRPPTSGTLGRRPTRVDRRVARFDGPHLNNWIVFRQIEDLRFRRVFKDVSRNGSRPRLTAWSIAGGGQATKGTRWMPWRQEPMKDVAGCEKLRGVASRR
jgi:hypothetical protein